MKKLFTFIVAALSVVCANARLVTYPAPEGAKLNDDFTVRVRQAGGEWRPVDTYLVYVDEVAEAKHTVRNSSMAYFDFDGSVDVMVINKKGVINEAKVRPLSFGIDTETHGDTLYFSLDRPRNLSVEINGDIFANLQLFANPIDTNRPKKTKAKNLIYFAPGLHRIEGDTLWVKSGQTVYIAGGAVVDGCIEVCDVHDVKILGRGMVYPHRKMGVRIGRSKNVIVDGIMTTQCAVGGSDSVKVNNVKVISYYGWGDGLNVFASNNVFYDGVFCRTSDDCTTVYATRKGYSGSCRNIEMRNAVLWADVAHPIFIGIHGSVENHDVIEDVRYENIDILDAKEKQIDYQGCLAINAGDNNLVRNVKFENIRVEDFRQGQLVNVRIFYNEKYCGAPGLGIEDILFKDITYNGKNAEISIIAGYDKERKVKNIRFENLKINGVVISDDMKGKPGWYKTGDMARFFIGEHVEGVTFSK